MYRLAAKDQICPRNFLHTSDSDITVSLHLVIPFISMEKKPFFRHSANDAISLPSLQSVAAACCPSQKITSPLWTHSGTQVRQ